MAEKGILIKDQAGGKSVATRDAYELDDLDNTRIIPRVEFSGLHAPFPLVLARWDISSLGDGDAIPSLPAQLTDNLIACGDKTKLIAIAEYSTAGTNSAEVSLIYYDGEATPNAVAISDWLSINEADISRNADGSDIFSNPIVFDLIGSHQIGIRIKDNPMTAGLWKIWAYVI